VEKSKFYQVAKIFQCVPKKENDKLIPFTKLLRENTSFGAIAAFGIALTFQQILLK
jgi:hypothetical protein